MSLSRAFTTRRLKTSTADDAVKSPQRARTLRHKISAPLQLIHTTNMLSYNAPDLPSAARSTSSSSTGSNNSAISSISAVSAASSITTISTNATKSEDDSDSVATAESTPPTSPDVAVNHRSLSPEPNHLSGYFKSPGKPVFPADDEPAPAIPKRAPSHTKKNSYDAIARSRSVARMSRESDQSASTRSAHTFSRSLSTSTRASSISTPRSLKQPALPAHLSLTLPLPLPASTSQQQQQQPIKEVHPFGPELAQVTELAEEYSSSSQLKPVDEDAEYLRSRGLVKLTVDDYLDVIQGVSSYFFPEMTHVTAIPAPLWI